MNVLIFVMTMLMLLALLTFARLDSYRSSQVFQTIFKYYMEKDERGYYNLKAQQIYDKIKVSTSTKDGKPAPKAEGSPRIGIALLFDKKKREDNPKGWLQTQTLLKNLISTLYGEQPFYQKAIEEHNTIVDELIAAITRTVDALETDKKPKSAAGLANLKLNDPKLDQFLYKMLQGSTYLDITSTNSNEKAKEQIESDVDAGDADTANASAEFTSPEGYYSLLDFVTAKSDPKVRVYLAPKEVLQSIYHDSQTVDAIITERNKLYKQAIAGTDPKDLTTTFKDQFDRQKDSGIDESSLNYTVTKTNPKYYE